MNNQVSLKEIEENYGSDLVSKLEWDIKNANENGWNFKVEIIKESKYFTTIVFATHAFSEIYAVSNKRKVVDFHNHIGSVDCRKVLKLMDSFKA